MFHHFYQHCSEGGRFREDRHEARFARFGGGMREEFREGFREKFGRGHHAGGRERMFDAGEFQLVLLHLIAEKPSYGYQLIKTLEEKLAGGYAPSPGVIYPTLTMLEEEGLTQSATEAGRKVYTVTPAGQEQLATRKQRLDEILERLQQTGEGFERGRTPEFRRSFRNLQQAVLLAAARARRTPGSDTIRKIVEAIDTATKTIDGL